MNTAASEAPDLFDRIAAACGLSSLLASGLLRRALADTGKDRTTALPEDYLAALPKIAGRMRAYLPNEEVETRLSELQSLITRKARTP